MLAAMAMRTVVKCEALQRFNRLKNLTPSRPIKVKM